MFIFGKKYRRNTFIIYTYINTNQNWHEHMICYRICFYNNPKLNNVVSNIIDIEKNVFKVNGSSKLLV